MRRICCLGLACLLLGICAVAAGEGSVAVPTVESATVAAPREENYIMEDGKDYAVGYQDPTLEIHITEGRYLDTTWTAARIKVAYPAQLRTCMYRDRYGAGAGVGEYVMSYAMKKSAVFAINDDWFMSQFRQNTGCVTRQGVNYRMRCNGYVDILGIDDQGDFHVFENAKNEDIENFPGTLVNTFVFGPVIVQDYKAREEIVDNAMGAFHETQRMGIGQIGPLEYICVCCEGPEDPGSRGLTVKEFGELVASFGDVKVFYNLDGGSSSTMVFRGKDKRGNETLWAKINAPQNSKVRTAGGCIYFISAWIPEGEEVVTIQ